MYNVPGEGQANEGSNERGRLCSDVWAGHSSALASVLLRLRNQATSSSARCGVMALLQ